MPNKPGSSSYDRGDTGGAHGDYEHGVSTRWVEKMTNRGAKGASTSRLKKFGSKMGNQKAIGGLLHSNQSNRKVNHRISKRYAAVAVAGKHLAKR